MCQENWTFEKFTIKNEKSAIFSQNVGNVTVTVGKIVVQTSTRTKLLGPCAMNDDSKMGGIQVCGQLQPSIYLL